MPRRILLSVFAIPLTAVTASAADLPAQSRIGAIFAEPAAVHSRAQRPARREAPIIPFNGLPNPPWARGGYTYGSSYSYYYGGPYYGGTYVSYVVRLPYVCGFLGYC